MTPALGTAAPRQETDPVAAVGRFVAGFTHRLRSPLTGLRGYGELAEREEDRARRAYWHQQLQGGLDSLDLLLEGFRRYQIPEQVARRPQPARRLVEEAWRLAGRVTPGSATKRVTLSIDLPEGREWRVDAFHYRNLLVNLFQNALDASPEGGRVRVSEDGEAVLRVEDEGPGLGELGAAEIVQPFFTTRADRAGLGLTVASRIACEHGQSLCWQARPTGGLAALIVIANPAEQQRSLR
ncbi:MAG: HAMP domain-containing sensor histidine kinase [Candidatus Krumholzibacteriia bacterium]|nr:HAMP domain-containing histidine kinase [bacterium]MCB9515208.1 HAMP domain-containing histidine kinase [Candidatus Latescibacterota bacterium]